MLSLCSSTANTPLRSARSAHLADSFICIVFNVRSPFLHFFLEPVNPIVSFKRRGLGSQSGSGTTVEQVQKAFFSARPGQCAALRVRQRPDALFCSFALFKTLRFPNTKNQSLQTSCQVICIHRALASAACRPAARATTGGKQLNMVQALSRQQARWYREGLATCRRGWCRARQAAPLQAELELSSCRRRRPFAFGPRPFGTRDTSTKAALSLGGVDVAVDCMDKLPAWRLQRNADGNKGRLNCARSKLGSFWRCLFRALYASFPF